MTTTTGTITPVRTPRRPTGLPKLVLTEIKLYLREPAATFFTVMLPLGLLLALGSAIPDLRKPDPALGGQAVVDTQLPAMMILLAAMTAAFNMIPAVLAVYRERGVLRRLSVTPASPGALLAAQLVINVAMTVIAAFLMILFGHLVLGSQVPANLVGFVLVFLLGVCALFTIGLTIAAVVPSSRAAGAAGAIVMFPLLFLAGMWVPRELMPAILRHVSDFTPAGAFGQVLRDTWAGVPMRPLHLVVLVAWAVGAGVFAARAFRWE
jgi:ABC-2 type transport system permease protein